MKKLFLLFFLVSYSCFAQEYPVKTVRLHHSFPDPAGQSDEPQAFRDVRDQIKPVIERLILEIKAGRTPTEAALLEPGLNG